MHKLALDLYLGGVPRLWRFGQLWTESHSNAEPGSDGARRHALHADVRRFDRVCAVARGADDGQAQGRRQRAWQCDSREDQRPSLAPRRTHRRACFQRRRPSNGAFRQIWKAIREPMSKPKTLTGSRQRAFASRGFTSIRRSVRLRARRF